MKILEIIAWILTGLCYVGSIYSCIAGVHISFCPLKRSIQLTLLLACLILLHIVSADKILGFFDLSELPSFLGMDTLHLIVGIILTLAKITFSTWYYLLSFQTMMLFIED